MHILPIDPTTNTRENIFSHGSKISAKGFMTIGSQTKNQWQINAGLANRQKDRSSKEWCMKAA